MKDNFSILRKQIESRLNHRQLIYNDQILTRWASVNLILHYSDTNCWHLAMIKRVENDKDPWSGHYAFPGGRVELGEAHLDAALRETREEVGLSLAQDDSLGPFYSFQIKVQQKPINLGIASIVTLINGELPQLSPQPSEVEQAFWFKLSDLLSPQYITKDSFSGYTGNFFRPCIKFDGHTIWGISYSILRELVNQLSGLKMSDQLIIDSNVLPTS